MKPRMFSSIVAVAIFVVLAIPITIAAQTEQEQHNNHSNGFVKNLDTLGEASTIAEWRSGTDSGIAGTSPVALSGTGTTVELNPSSLNFGNVLPGHQKTLTSIMTNVGNTTLHITSLTIAGMGFYEKNNCGSALGSQQSCDINVTFAPAGHYGNFSGTVFITDDGEGSPQQVSLSGSSNPIFGKYCNCGGLCSIGCLTHCGCHGYSSEALLEQEPSSPVSCNANWSDRLPEFRERY